MADLRHLPAQEVHRADDDAGRGGNAASSRSISVSPNLLRDERRERIERRVGVRDRRRAEQIVEPNSAASIITPMMLLPFTSRSSRTMVISLLNFAGQLHDLGRGPRVQPVLVDDL